MTITQIAQQLQALEFAHGVDAEVELSQEGCTYISSGLGHSIKRAMNRLYRVIVTFLGYEVDSAAEHVNARALVTIFGAERVEAVCGLHPPETVRDISKIFRSLATPTLSDLERALQEGIEEEGYDFTLETATGEQIQALYDRVAPFGSLHELFFSSIPPLDRPAVDSGKTFFGDDLRIRVLYELAHNHEMTHDQWVTLVAKQLTPLEVSPGTMVRGYDGTWYTVHSTVSASGSYATFLKVVGDNPENKPAIVLYRGTHPTPIACEGFNGVVEDIRPDIGTQGIINSYDQLEKRLTDPEEGFIQPGQSVWVMGMSLGGTHAQRLATLFPDIVRKVSLVSSPGIDEATCDLYAEVVAAAAGEQEGVEPPSIEMLIDADDITDSMGQMHLGAHCADEHVNLRVTLYDPDLSRDVDEVVAERRMPAEYYPAAATMKFFSALSTAHIALTAWKAHKRVVWKNNREAGEPGIRDIDDITVHDIFEHADSFYDASWERLRHDITLRRYLGRSPDENHFVGFAREKLRNRLRHA